MAGYITRVITITYGARYLKLPSHVPERTVRTRGPLMSDAMLKYADALPVPAVGCSSGPCGTAARRSLGGLAFLRLVEDLKAYAERWGDNPLGAKFRTGTGAKEGKRGRGPQDYLFQRKGAGDGDD